MRSTLLLALTGCGTNTPTEEPLNVVVLVLDGARVDETFSDTHTGLSGSTGATLLPRIHGELLPQGTLVQPGYAHGITLTAPAHCDMLTGRRQSFANFANSSGPGAYLPVVPTLFEVLREAEGLSESQLQLFGSSNLIEPLKHSLYPGMSGGAFYSINEDNAASDVAVLKRTRGIITESRPRLTVVNLHEVDRSGHYGTEAQYLENISDLDDAIMEFWGFLSALDGYAGRTVMVLVSDHGRHRIDGEDDAWHQHGDHCAGCRETVMFLVGPGIEAGAISTTPYALEDLGHTLASLLDVELPYSHGILMSDVLSRSPDTDTITGPIRPAWHDGLIAVEERTVAPAARARMVLDGESLPSGAAAEAPRVARGPDADFACWRALDLTPGEEWMPWLGVCQRRESGGEWVDLEFPEEVVSPLFAPAIAADDSGGLWVAYVDNPGVHTDAIAELRVLRWAADAGWNAVGPDYIQLTVPTDPALVLTEDGPLIAVAGSSSVEDSRDTRQVHLLGLDAGSWQNLATITPADLGVDRIEKPALWTDGSTIHLAGLSHTSDLTTSAWMLSGTRDALGGPGALEETGRLLGHVAPRFTATGEAVWAQVDEGDGIEVCRGTGAGSSCIDTEATYLDGLAITDEGVLAAIRTARSPWALAEIPW